MSAVRNSTAKQRAAWQASQRHQEQAAEQAMRAIGQALAALRRAEKAMGAASSQLGSVPGLDAMLRQTRGVLESVIGCRVMVESVDERLRGRGLLGLPWLVRQHIRSAPSP